MTMPAASPSAQPPSAQPPSTQPPSAQPLALVAGASRGLGLLIARELGMRGYRLVICARDADELAVARQLLTEHGFGVQTEVCDVADETAVATLVDGVEERLGPIEVAVVVAGVIQVGPLASMTRQHFEEAISIMLWGPINVTLAVVERMRPRRQGRIGVVTSVGGLISVPHLLPYSTAKFGAVGFTSGLRSELAGTGIKVTTVAPGLMRTGSHLRAKFVGRQSAEFGWFALGASLPGVSMNAERAAERIVDGVLAGRAYVVLTPLAQVGMRVNGLAPGFTAGLLGVMARLLPTAPTVRRNAVEAEATIEGWQAEQQARPVPRKIIDGLTTLGRTAAGRWNQRPR